MRARALVFLLLRAVVGLPTPDVESDIALVGSAPTLAIDHLYPAAPVNASATRQVYAHFMLDIVQSYDVEDWAMDMLAAKAIGVDGFALNTGLAAWTNTQLGYAYEAARRVNFTCLISFDFVRGLCDSATLTHMQSADPGFSDYKTQIVPLLQQHAESSVAAYYSGGLLVSTFIGDGFNWDGVRALMAPRSLTVVPNYQPSVAVSALSIDGLLSWNAWPTDATASPVNSAISEVFDFAYQVALAGRYFMMSVSPWFWRHNAGTSSALRSELTRPSLPHRGTSPTRCGSIAGVRCCRLVRLCSRCARRHCSRL